jgi:hypothetical protein
MKATATQRVCVYGAPKSGKTLLVGQLAQHFDLLWFDCEQGWSTLLQLPPELQSRIDIVSIPDSKTYPIAVETWLKVIKGDKHEICEEHGKSGCAICKKAGAAFTTVELARTPQTTIVVFDSLTQLTQSIIANITRAKPDDYKLEFDDWGNVKTLVEKFLSQVQAAGYNIICITHEEETEFEDKKKKIVPVCGSSKSSRNTAKYFDHVVYVEVKNKKHVGGSMTDYGMNIVTGSRTNVAVEKSPELSLLPFFAHLLDGGDNNGSSNISVVAGSNIPEGVSGAGKVTDTKINQSPAQNAMANLLKKAAQ